MTTLKEAMAIAAKEVRDGDVVIAPESLGSWDVAMIDPPWPKKKGGLRNVRPNQGRELDYKTMSVPEIFTLLDSDVFSCAAPVHTVFLWGVEEHLMAGESEMSKRGYRRHARIIWDKCNGVAPAFSLRYAHEYLTWYYKPNFRPVSVESRGKLTSVLREPAREHSRKPEAAYNAIKFWYPNAVCADIFSRESRPGWLQWGDQPQHFGATTSALDCPVIGLTGDNTAFPEKTTRTCFGLADNDNVFYLGEHADFFGADKQAKATGRDYVLIFDQEIFDRWVKQVANKE